MSLKVKTLNPVPHVGEDDGDAGQAVLDGAAEDGVVEVEALVWPVLSEDLKLYFQQNLSIHKISFSSLSNME